MNKNTVLRSFALRYPQDEETHEIFTELTMYSLVDGPFGPIQLNTTVRLDGVSMSQTVTQDSASPSDLVFSIRLGEMNYFINNIVPLFNPTNVLSYELPQPQAEEPSSF